MSEVLNVEEIFGQNVFTMGKMKERLPKNVYREAVSYTHLTLPTT